MVIAACFALLQRTQASPILELRGVLHTDSSGWIFSIHAPETGGATWLRMHQTRNGYSVKHYDPNTHTATIQYGEEEIKIRLMQKDDYALPVQFSVTQLTTYNRQLYEQRKNLIVQKANTYNSNSTKQGQIAVIRKTNELGRLLMSNPSLDTVNEYFGELDESLDYAALMKIPSDPGVESRNAQNTAGWGIKKNVDQKKLEETLKTNPSIEAINELVAAK